MTDYPPAKLVGPLYYCGTPGCVESLRTSVASPGDGTEGSGGSISLQCLRGHWSTIHLASKMLLVQVAVFREIDPELRKRVDEAMSTMENEGGHSRP